MKNKLQYPAYRPIECGAIQPSSLDIRAECLCDLLAAGHDEIDSRTHGFSMGALICYCPITHTQAFEAPSLLEGSSFLKGMLRDTRARYGS